MPTDTCSRTAPCRSEGRDWPDIYNLTDYTDKFAGKHRAPRLKFPTAAGALPRSRSAADALSPGEYRVDRDLVLDAKGECCAPLSARVSLSSSFALEARTARDGALKGNSTSANNKKTNPLGPGQYLATDPAAGRKAAAQWSIPRGAETQEAVRHRKSQGASLGPGAYDMRSPLSETSAALDSAIFSLPRSQRRCRHKQQFGHIFAATRPKPMAPSAGAAASAAPAGERDAGRKPKLTEKDALTIFCSFGR